MSLRRIASTFVVLSALNAPGFTQPVRAQAPTIPEGASANPGSSQSLLGPVPGSAGVKLDAQPPGAGQIIGARPGSSSPRVPTSISTPGQAGTGLLGIPNVAAIPAIPPLTEVPLYGRLEFAEADDPGPEDGLTYDAALEMLLKANIDLLARRFEIPAADADVLTAGLRANPILYADSQLVPYGNYTNQRPGGQTQYDVNISQPIDYSGKRKARTALAVQARRAVEAQYQDAVRLQIANLSTAYVAVLAARETIRYVERGLEGQEAVFRATQALASRGNRNSTDVARIEAQREAASVGLMDANEALIRANRTLGTLLGVSIGESDQIRLRASLRVTSPAVPDLDELVGMALQCRPDVVAGRIGVDYANSGLKLQKANRFADAYLLYQPYTFQNNAPVGLKSAYSYALGLTVPLPLYNRNQGNIERAKINIDQTRVQLTAVERQVVLEVSQADREYRTTRTYLDRLESKVLPVAKKAVDDTRKLLTAGELVDITPLLNVEREYNDVVRQYRDTAIRHRRSMLNLNTVVGRRILP